MIYFLRGKIFLVKNDTVIIETNNTGYEILMNTKDIEVLSKKIGEEVILYTYLLHKEDNMSLFGFLDESSRKGFLNIQKVDGIGPKLAQKILSFYDIEGLYELIQKEDIASLKKIPGVGPKMASKMVFDLKGVIPQLKIENISGIEKDILTALINLGYDEKIVAEKINSAKPLGDNFESEFKKILKLLSGK